MSSKQLSWSLKVSYVDAPAGFGKTIHGINWALERMREGKKILYVLKSIALINEQFEKTRHLANNLSNLVYRINGDGRKIKGSVKAKIKQHLEKSVCGTGEILFITEAAMMSLRYFPKPENWIVIFDEVPTVESEIAFKSPDNHTILTRHLKDVKATDEYVRLIPKDKQARRSLNKVARNPRADDVWKVFMRTADYVGSSEFEVYVSRKVWDNHSNQKKPPKDKFITHSILHPCKLIRFEKVIMMGAMFKESLLYQIWNKKWSHGVEFAPFEEVLNEIREKSGSAKHLITSKLTIKYITELPWTKKLARIQVNEKSALSYAIEMVVSEFNQDEFVYSLNKSIGESLELGRGIRLSGSPHGINKYKHINKGAFLSAINPKPETCRFYQSLGLSMADIKKAFMFQYCYQALMRTSLRDPNSTKEVIIVVPSKEIAEWFKTYFEGDVLVEQMQGFPEKEVYNQLNLQRISMSNAQRQDKRRRREWLNEIKELNDPINNDHKLYINREDVTDQSTLELNSNQIKIQFFSNRRERPSEEKVLHCNSWKDLFLALRGFSTRKIEKHDNSLLSAAIFGNKLIDGAITKRLENVRYCSCIIIDRDDGSLTYRQFLDLFPGINVCVYNSSKGDGRFRAIIPLSKKVPAAVYTDICRSIRAKIESIGFSRIPGDPLKPCHGIDANGFSATSVFYIPCLPKTDKQEDSFFVVQEGNPMDPESFVKDPLHNEVQTYNYRNTKASESLEICISENERTARWIKALEKIKEYIAIDKSTSPDGNRRAAFMGVGRTLKNLQCSESEIIQGLMKADHDGARREDIMKVMKTLKES